MIINEIPEVIVFDNVDEETNEAVETEANVMFISNKYVQAESGSGGESFVVICYDKDNNIYELFLNQVKILKTKKYDKNRSTWDSSSKRRRKRAGNTKGDNNARNKEVNTPEGESVPGGVRDPGEANGS